jgi:hypothetical protein
MNDDELEQALRSGLQRRADEADVSAPVLSRVRPGRPRRRAGAVLAAAGLVAATVVTVAVVEGRAGPEPEVVPVPLAPGTSATEAPGPAGEWRTEVWRDVQVDVPADWGYGGAPDENGTACFPARVLDAGAGSAPGGVSSPGYVGRPVIVTDECASVDRQAPLTGPYVWLGAGVEPGAVQLADGYVQETVAAGGTTVTVATPDPGLRRRILASVAESESCLSELDRDGSLARDRSSGPDDGPVSLRVCTYRLTEPSDSRRGWELTSATQLGTGSLNDYLAAVAAGEAPEDQCPTVDYQLTEAAVLEILDGEGQVFRRDAVNPTSFCAGVAVDSDRVWPLRTTSLTAAMTRPWVVGAVGAVLHGDPALGFIGPLS